jgi:hypothetical protein
MGFESIFPKVWVRSSESTAETMVTARLLPMAHSIEPIRLRTTAGCDLGGRRYSGITICGQVTTGGHGFRTTPQWVRSGSASGVGPGSCPLLLRQGAAGIRSLAVHGHLASGLPKGAH